MMVIRNSIVLFIWLVGSIYIGVGGFIQIEADQAQQSQETDDSIPVEYQGVVFKSKEALDNFLIEQGHAVIFPCHKDLPHLLILIITASSFGALGGVTRLVLGMVREDKKLIHLKVVTVPLLGVLTGIVVLGISYLIPSIIMSKASFIRPSTLTFISLFAGLFYERFYEWLPSVFTKIITKKI